VDWFRGGEIPAPRSRRRACARTDPFADLPAAKRCPVCSSSWTKEPASRRTLPDSSPLVADIPTVGRGASRSIAEVGALSRTGRPAV